METGRSSRKSYGESQRACARRVIKLQLRCQMFGRRGEQSREWRLSRTQTGVSTSAGFSFSLRQAAQFDAPANKRFWEAATQQAVTQTQRNVEQCLEVVQLRSATVGACTSGRGSDKPAIPVMRIRFLSICTTCSIRVRWGLEPRSRYAEVVFFI